MKELELQGKSKPKSLPLDSSKTFDVTKHIRLVPPFQEQDGPMFSDRSPESWHMSR